MEGMADVMVPHCGRWGGDVMLSEIIWFHVQQPLLSAFWAILESNLQAKLNRYFGFMRMQSAICSFLGMEDELTHIL